MHKYILMFFSFILLVSSNYAQDKMCCSTMAPAKFASLGSDKEFRMAHADPLPFNLKDAKGKMITFPTDDGKEANAYFIKADKKTDEYILVFHEWYGLNDYVKKESEWLYDNLHVNVLALDLYDGKVADNREDAAKYMQSVKNERAFSIIKGAKAYAGEDASFATIGWCFGGGWSLQAAIELGKKANACVMFYGMPEEDHERLKKIESPVFAIFAEKDGWITPEVAAKFEANMTGLNKKVKTKSFNADHGFANPSNPVYNSEAAKEAKAEALAFLKKELN